MVGMTLFLPRNWFVILSGLGMAINSVYDRLGSDSGFSALARFFRGPRLPKKYLKSI